MDALQPTIDQYGLWSASEWSMWIDQQVLAREQIFLTDPDELIAAYNREVGYTRDYHGRELLELIQNADDAGVDSSQSSRAIIVLSENGLCVGNTGYIFSPGGVKSLMISDNSPKQFQRTRYIGNRGLGFRSILSWTDCPFILSGNLSLGFNRERARAWLEQLCARYTNIQAKVEQFHQATTKRWPVPTLVFPTCLPDDGERTNGQPPVSTFPAIWTAARALRRRSYDTVVVIPFTVPNAFGEVTAQLEQIGREVMLFLRNLRELIIQRPDSTVIWRVERADDLVTIHSLGEPEQYWRIFEATGVIPDTLLSDDLKDTPGYEMKLAIPLDTDVAPGFLFNYFPTQVRFPFPLVAHATLQVTNNRQNIVESPANRFLVEVLAELMVVAAEGSQDSARPWRPLELIAATGSLDPVLEKLGFQRALAAAARSRSLVPVLGRGWVVPEYARQLAAGKWLPVTSFEDVVIVPEAPSLRAIISALGVNTLEADDLRKRLNLLSPALSFEERVALIAGLVTSRLTPDDPPPELLLDSSGTLIPASAVTFLPPADGSTVQMPAWMDLRILDSALTAALRQLITEATRRDWIAAMSPFRLREYALAPLALAINARASSKIQEEPQREHDYRIEALRTVYSLYMQTGAETVIARPADLHIPVPMRSGGFAAADTLYLTGDYPGGLLTDLLYSSFAPELLVARPDALQLDDSPERIGTFLRWLGVADCPRETTHTDRNQFLRFTTTQLSYPLAFEDVVIQHDEKLPDPRVVSISSIDRLGDVLQYADPHAILAWVARDTRLDEWRSRGDRRAKLQVYPPNKRYYRDLRGQTLPSYVVWRLEHTAWLPTSNSDRRAPNRCVFATNLPDDLRALLPQPAIQIDHPIFKEMGIDRIKLRATLEQVGVNPGLDQLSWDEFYTLLLSLPRIDPEGRSARSLYRTLLSRSDDGGTPSGMMRQTFLRTGRLWGKRGDTASYVPIEDLYYVDAAIIPPVVMRQLFLLDLDRRRGAQKVERLLGVTPLDNRGIHLQVTTCELSTRAEDMTRELDELKPYIYALRMHADLDAGGLTRLRALNVQLCIYAQGTAQVGGDAIAIELHAPGDLLQDGNIAYLVAVADEHDTLLRDELIADALGEVLAGIFRVERGSDFARLVSCVPERRLGLLTRILGIDLDEARRLLQLAREKLQIQDSTEPDGVRHTPWTDPPVPSPPPLEKPASSHTSEVANTNANDTEPPSGQQEPVGPVTAERKDHLPAPPPRRVRLRVANTPPTADMPRLIRQITDAVRCQQVALRFEEAEGQERYPLPADHITGSDAYGCDILSFDSAEKRDQFRQRQNPDLVSRFIEVKGRKSERGTIELKGNELRAAKKYGDRYYLYRVYESGPGEFDIMILQNPAAAPTRNPVYEIDLSREYATNRWYVSEIDAETDDECDNVDA